LEALPVGYLKAGLQPFVRLNEYESNPITKKEKTMISKKTAVMAALAITTWAFLAFGPLGDQAYGGGENGKAIKAGGAWLVVNQELGIRGLQTVSPIDPSGKRAVHRQQTISADPTVGGLCPRAYLLSDVIGEAIITGPSTAEATAVGYAMRKPVLPEIRDQIECIWVLTSTSDMTKDTQEIAVNIAVYPTWGVYGTYPNPDVDGDMLPDEGVEPYVCLPFVFQATRVPMLPLCEP
jgi:hypothetical protein